MDFLYILFLIASIFFLGTESINNGTFISIKEAPYFVSLINKDNDFACAGTIISKYWIVTAAHCIDESIYGISSGSSSKTKGLFYKIEKIIVHGDYMVDSEYELGYDIALLKLKVPISFNEYQQPIPIASVPPKPDDTLVVIGMGSQGYSRPDPLVLKKTEVVVVDPKFCDEIRGYRLGDSDFCAGDRLSDACPGDSGGPGIINGELAGIVSVGPNCESHERMKKGDPADYTNIHFFFDWIIMHTGIKYL